LDANAAVIARSEATRRSRAAVASLRPLDRFASLAMTVLAKRGII
jgi:hypothetical protein